MTEQNPMEGLAEASRKVREGNNTEYEVILRDYGRPRGRQAGPMSRDEAIQTAKRMAHEASEERPGRIEPHDWKPTPSDSFRGIGYIKYGTKQFIVRETEE